MSITRRQFMVGCSAAIAAMAGGRLGNMVFANPAETSSPLAATNEILVTIFLRGGCDGLNLVAPFDDARYVAARGSIRIPENGAQNGALLIDPRNSSYSNSSNFGFHFRASGLKELYDTNKLAIIHACGLDDDTRSHFDAMDYMERGTPGQKRTPTGWLTRHLQSIDAAGGVLPTVAASSSVPASLLSDPDAVALTNVSNYGLSSGRYNGTNSGVPEYATVSPMMATLKKFYTGSSILQQAGKRTIESIEVLKGLTLPDSTAGVTYQNNSFGNTLKMVAQIIKLDLGLRIATVDFGGWDTHENQGSNGDGYFGTQIDTLSRGLHAFYNDLASFHNRLTVVVMSEFGRRLGVNASGGTDHGHGNTMMVLGGNVNGGKLYGNWPGLEDLDQSQDLRITTDYRTVLSEILVRRLGNPKLGTVFPGITPAIYATNTALGVVNGSDLAIDYTANAGNVYLPLVVR